MIKNIVLIGFMGTGKSSCGRTLANQLGFKFIDLDKAIEAKFGMSIPEMFSQHGEEYFRAREKEMVREFAFKRNLVIATGGGTVRDPENTALLKKNGKIVCLTAAPEIILVRTARQGTRPVLDMKEKQVGDRKKAIIELLEERKDIYKQADYYVDTGDRSPLEVSLEIISYMKRA